MEDLLSPLFTWDDVSYEVSSIPKELKKYINEGLGIQREYHSIVKKKNDREIIIISNNPQHNITIELNDQPHRASKAILRFDGDEHELDVRHENNRIKIYGKIMLSRHDLAKYPFLSSVKVFFHKYKLNYSIDEFEGTKVVEHAIHRIKIAMRYNNDEKIYDEFTYITDAEIEIPSFFIAIIILHMLHNNILSKRFALTEAKRVEKFLRNDLEIKNEKRKALQESFEDIRTIKVSKPILDIILKVFFREYFNLDIRKDSYNNIYKIKVVDYLKRSTHFHDPHWKLINKDVYEGYVELDVDSLIRLIRDDIINLIYKRIQEVDIKPKNIPDYIKNIVENLRSELMKNKIFQPAMKTSNREYPPCITHILHMLEKGENPPHTARFLLATYMLAIGKSIDEVCSLFEQAPDYNEKITRYQVEFLAGIKGSKKSYNCPNCDKIASQNLCYKTDDCDSIKSPLQFKRVKR
ncbi:MAG: hypothetical protein KatS3mg003_0118 [Candidatus Nitrosocaldaceae archaeon]|nr:MAG: hypothetical protein KatS3mg003_0118 [Candidatus Nitrosocaldaceae archaeon]